MKVSLRKAKVLQEDLLDVLKQIATPASIKITEFTQDVDDAISTGLANYKAAVSGRIDLVTLLYYIREQVGIKNAEAGIDSLLTVNDYRTFYTISSSITTGTISSCPVESYTPSEVQ